MRLLLLLLLSVTAHAADTDSIPDQTDNCYNHTNQSQCDSDADGYGNRCDGDLNQDNATNAQDAAIFRSRLGTSNAAADLNCNGAVNAQDYAIFRALLGAPPGPSGRHTAWLSWQAPTTNTNGTPLTDLTSYNIYAGNPSLIILTNVVAAQTSAVIGNLPTGTWNFAIAAINSHDDESVFSTIVTKIVP